MSTRDGRGMTGAQSSSFGEPAQREQAPEIVACFTNGNDEDEQFDKLREKDLLRLTNIHKFCPELVQINQ